MPETCELLAKAQVNGGEWCWLTYEEVADFIERIRKTNSGELLIDHWVGPEQSVKALSR